MYKKIAIKIVRAVLIGGISSYAFCPNCFLESSNENLFRVFLYYILTFFIIYELVLFKVKIISKKLNWIKDYKKIIFINALFIIVIFLPLNYIAINLIFGIYPERYSGFTLYFLNLNNFFTTIIVLLYINSKNFFFFWKETYTKTQELAKHKIKSELLALKNQINPHFLFNNLNTLTHLISKKNNQAEEYIFQLSKIYRYLLDEKNSDIVSINKEVKMLNSFIYLLHVKYEKNIQFLINKEKFNVYKIATFTLQMLVENAVKHNVISNINKLIITIEINKDYLIIKNNVLDKPNILYSSGIGLENIINRYKLLTNYDVLIIESDKEFIVKIPLLK